MCKYEWHLQCKHHYGLYIVSLEVHHQPHVLEGNNGHLMATNKS